MREIVLAVDIIIEPDVPGFHAYCPALEGLHVGGDTVEEALQNARDAVELYVQDLIEDGDPIPIGVQTEEETSGSKENGTRHREHLKLVPSPCRSALSPW